MNYSTPYWYSFYILHTTICISLKDKSLQVIIKIYYILYHVKESNIEIIPHLQRDLYVECCPSRYEDGYI